MKRKYQGVIVLKMQGQEESLDDSVNAVTKEMEAAGATMDQIDRLGRKEFAHENHAKQKAGYYVQYHFEADPQAIKEMEDQLKLKMKEQVMLQYYSVAK
ncbi:MAG: 30S ribosomal protein S6 [Verrucomicrobiales bacterium]|nr:30S ribosomal protein S6 [Verrucomicrobiales bacterium]